MALQALQALLSQNLSTQSSNRVWLVTFPEKQGMLVSPEGEERACIRLAETSLLVGLSDGFDLDDRGDHAFWNVAYSNKAQA